MICRDFEKIACDLAAGCLMETGARERALRHAADCVACAARLSAERALNAGLRALAESDEHEKAPAHLKLALRAAFDQQAKMPAAPVLTFGPARARNTGNWARWSLAAAALILFAIAVALLARDAAPNSKDKLSVENPQPSPTPAAWERSPQQVAGQENRKQKYAPGPSKPSSKRHAPPHVTAPDDVADNNETVTDYIPLTYLADATALESGIVVRVELSHSALIAMGAPVNIERTDLRVKADVVVGDDGVARAVRFVQQDSARR